MVFQWLEEHQFLESLIQIVTGNYVAEGGERDLPDLNHNQAGDDQRDPLGKHYRGDSLQIIIVGNNTFYFFLPP